MTVRGERGISQVYDVPTLADRYNDKDPLDASRAMTELVSNPSHLCEESVRPLIWDVGGDYTQFDGNDYGVFVASSSNDIEPPTPSQATRSWQLVGHDRRMTRRYGPYTISADETADGDVVIAQNGKPRRVRVVVEFEIGAIDAQYSAVFAVMTRTGDINDVLSNRYLAAAEVVSQLPTPTFVVGSNLVRLDLEPAFAIDALRGFDRSLPSAPTAGARRVATPVHTYCLHIGAAGWGGSVPSFEIVSVSAFEIRE